MLITWSTHAFLLWSRVVSMNILLGLSSHEQSIFFAFMFLMRFKFSFYKHPWNCRVRFEAVEELSFWGTGRNMMHFPRNFVIYSHLGNRLACCVLLSNPFMLLETRVDFMCNGTCYRKKVLKGIVCINRCENLRKLDNVYVFKVYGSTTVIGQSFSQKENFSLFVCGKKIPFLTFRYP